MTGKRRFNSDIDGEEEPIHTPGGMVEPASDRGRASDGADIASTDMSQKPSSREEDTQPLFGEGRDPGQEAELQALKDKHLRLAAEFDNYRKRMSRERSELTDRAQANFVARLLDVLDDMDRLVSSMREGTPLPALQEALTAVDRKLWKELEAAGVERIDPTGESFDPSEHEAVSVVAPPSPAKDHTVSATFQTGYRFKGAMIRPARVQVFSEQGSA